MIRVGLVGVGYFGKNHLRILGELPYVELVRVGGREEVDAILADTTIAAVIIATPTATHTELAVRALSGGKHVLLEKPLAVNLAAAEQIAAAVASSGKVFQIGHQYLYHDAIIVLKQKIVAGEIGTPLFFQAMQYATSRQPAGIDCFTEMATHEFAILDFLATPGKIISVVGNHLINSEKREDAASVLINFSSGLHAAISVSWRAAKKTRRFDLLGTNGSAAFNDLLPTEKLIMQNYSLATSETPVLDLHEPLKNELTHFFDCIKNDTQPRTDIEHGLRVMRWLELCKKSFSDNN